MRGITAAAVIAVALAALAVCGRPAQAMNDPLAGLAPADVSTYSEVNLDRMLGKTPETAALGETYARLRSPEILRAMLTEVADDPQVAAQVGEVLGLLKSASSAIGPRVAIATWIPDAQAMTGGMMGVGSPTEMLPKVLVLADIRDPAGFDALIGAVATKAKLQSRVSTLEGGLRVTTFAEGMVELIRGDTWMALGFPPEQARKAADFATGKLTTSLSQDSGYQRVLNRLPADAFVTEYIAADSIKQLLAAVNLLVPSAGFAYPSGEPLGLAMGMHFQQIGGRQLVTSYTTADLDALVYLLDAPLTLQGVMLKPVLERSRAQARKAMCLSNLKNLAIAAQAYAADNDDRLPDADRWVEQLRSYRGKDEAFMRCSEDNSGAFSSYAMNRALSGISLNEIEDPASVVLFYETANPGANPVGDGSDLAPARHLEGSNYAFADGHAMWISEGEPPSFEP